jgi:uncharacterized membrane protein YbhN (UPF0104 family)
LYRRPAPLFIGSTFTIRVSAAVGGFFFLRAFGQEVPLSVNLFVIPLTQIIFLLPISFGSLGVREGTFIILYGLFGIPKEVAFAASSAGLLGLLLTVSIGGLIALIPNAFPVAEKET